MLNTQLKNRTLWFDGSSSYDPSTLLRYMRICDVKYVDCVDDSVRNYNRSVPKDAELSIKTECNPLDYTWNIPIEYKNLNVVDYISEKHVCLTSDMPSQESYDRDIRLAAELKRFNDHGLFDVLRSIIYIINTLTAEDVVWGVGRGSSVSSYVLYVIGVHDVDSFLYDLDITDFISDIGETNGKRT